MEDFRIWEGLANFLPDPHLRVGGFTTDAERKEVVFQSSEEFAVKEILARELPEPVEPPQW